MPNRYLKGVVALAVRSRSKSGESVIGTNFWQLLYNPKGIIDDVMNHPKSPELQLQAQNGYWGTQRAAGQANTAANRLGNTTAQQQLQATLQQQAAANAASLRAQFATTFPNVAMPTAPPAPFQVPQPTYAAPTYGTPSQVMPDGSTPPVVTSYDASGNPIYADPNAAPTDPSQSVVGAQNAYWSSTKTSDAASSANVVALRQQANAAVNASMAQEAATMFLPVDTAALAAAAQAANPYGTSPYGNTEYGVDSEPYYADGGGDDSPYDVVGATAPTDQYVVVHVKDIGAVVKSQSKLGGIAYGALPQTIANVAYGKIRDQISAALTTAGVAADVTVTTTPPMGKSTSDIFVGILAGAGGAAALWALAKLVMHKPHTGRR